MADTIDTLYGPLNASFFAQLKHIKLAVFDVDGVFSDGNIYLGNQGEELKAFNTKDGYGIKALAKCGIKVAIVTGRKSKIVETRMRALGVDYLSQGREDKDTAIKEIFVESGLGPKQTLSVGDDMPDIGMFTNSLIGVAVGDAHPYVKQQATYVTQMLGGKGAVREICDLLLQANGILYDMHGASV